MEWISGKDRLPEKTQLDIDNLVWEKPELLFWDENDGACAGWYSGSQFLVEDDARLRSMLDVTHFQKVQPPKEDVS